MMMMMIDDDDSDADDVRLSPDDAILVVAKTEEVRAERRMNGCVCSCRFQYSLISTQPHYLISYIIYLRTLLLWKFTSMKKRRETCLSITILHLPSFPLCLAHGDVNSNGEAGNYCAVGTFSPGIEVWNLDMLNPLEPSCILGGHDTSAADAFMKHNMARAASGKKLDKNSHVGTIQ